MERGGFHATQSLTSAASRRGITKQSSALLLIVVVIVAVGAGAGGYFLSMPGAAKSSSTTSGSVGTSTASSFKIGYDTIIVGYKGGLFQLTVQDLAGKQISGVVAILGTPVQAAMCSGGSTPGLGFGNCLPASGKTYTFSPAAGGSFPANATFTGYDSGAGPGSATVGQNYPLSIKVTYVDGTSSNETVSAPAVSG